MSLKFKLTSVFAVAVAAAGFTVSASAQDAAPTTKERIERHEKGERGGFRHGEKRMRGGHRGGMMRGLHALNLSDAQKEQIRAIHEANRPDKSNMEEMRSLMEAKRAGTLTAEQKEQFRAFRQNARAKREQVHAQVLAILTPEQRQQLELKKQEMKQRREERRNQRRENRGGTTNTPTDN